MPNLNKVMLMGHVTRDIELKFTTKGTAVASLGLAVNRTRTGEGAEKTTEVTFVDVTLWGRTAEIAHKYSGKGKPLFVEGRLHMESWEDKNTGQKRTKLKVVGENIQLLGSHGDGQQERPAPQASREPERRQPHHSRVGTGEGENLPF